MEYQLRDWNSIGITGPSPDSPPWDIIAHFHFYWTRKRLLQVLKDQYSLEFQGQLPLLKDEHSNLSCILYNLFTFGIAGDTLSSSSSYTRASPTLSPRYMKPRGSLESMQLLPPGDTPFQSVEFSPSPLTMQMTLQDQTDHDCFLSGPRGPVWKSTFWISIFVEVNCSSFIYFHLYGIDLCWKWVRSLILLVTTNHEHQDEGNLLLNCANCLVQC